MDKRIIFLLAFLLLVIPFVSAFGYNAPTESNVNIFVGNLTQLSQLVDVNIPTPNDNEVLTYNSGTGKWESNAASIGNASWNQSLANTLYWDILKGSYNATYATSSGDNVTWNESHANDLYWDIIKGSYNLTYASYAIANFSNKSNYWGNMSSFNATQMSESNGLLNILESWFSTLFDSLFSGKTTNDLTQGTTNFYDNRSWNETYADTLYGSSGNASWNQSLANTLYWDILKGSYNATYATSSGDNVTWNESHANTLYSGIEWNYNQTLATYNLWNTDWLSTYNATYDAKVSFPGFTDLLTDYGFTDNSATWDLYSYNHTLATYNLWNTDWLSTYNATYANNLDTNETDRVNLLNQTIISSNSSWISTYNATYDAKVSFPGWINVAWQNQSNSFLANNFTANQNMTGNNLTSVDCIIFESGGKICSS